MHILMLIVLGHLVLAAFVLVAGLINRGGSTVDGARPFIWVWLLHLHCQWRGRRGSGRHPGAQRDRRIYSDLRRARRRGLVSVAATSIQAEGLTVGSA